MRRNCIQILSNFWWHHSMFEISWLNGESGNRTEHCEYGNTAIGHSCDKCTTRFPSTRKNLGRERLPDCKTLRVSIWACNTSREVMFACVKRVPLN